MGGLQKAPAVPSASTGQACGVNGPNRARGTVGGAETATANVANVGLGFLDIGSWFLVRRVSIVSLNEKIFRNPLSLSLSCGSRGAPLFNPNKYVYLRVGSRRRLSADVPIP